MCYGVMLLFPIIYIHAYVNISFTCVYICCIYIYIYTCMCKPVTCNCFFPVFSVMNGFTHRGNHIAMTTRQKFFNRERINE